MSLVDVDVDGAEPGDGGPVVSSGNAEELGENIALHRGEEALSAEGLESGRCGEVEGGELVIFGVTVDRVADGELVFLGAENSAERCICIEKVEGHVEGRTGVPVDFTAAVLQRSRGGAIVFAAQNMTESIDCRFQSVRILGVPVDDDVLVPRTGTVPMRGCDDKGCDCQNCKGDERDLHGGERRECWLRCRMGWFLVMGLCV